VQHIKGLKSPGCDDCDSDHPFQMPKAITESLYDGTLVLFAGAGVSSEGASVPIATLYDEIRNEMGLAPETSVSFARLMGMYCDQPDGRAKLLRRIHQRFQYIRSHQQLYGRVTRFHTELATIHPIEAIITTNWDDYFERESGAVPLVTPEDFALWRVPGRKVFKIHGSVNNWGSIVATEQDYQKCYKSLRDGILGSTLRHLLGTRTVLYVGYRFADEDFQRIHGLLRRDMGATMPHGYIVTLDREAAPQLRRLGLTPIFTDATYFVTILKAHATKDQQMLDDERFGGVEQLLMTLLEKHSQLFGTVDLRGHPEVAYALSYQDGLIQSFERILTLKNTGYYSNPRKVWNAIRTYEGIRKAELRARRYFDVSYVDGYINGMIYLMLDDESRKGVPLYYVYGAEQQPKTYTQYRKLSAQASTLHKASYRHAQSLVGSLGENPDHLSVHHPPVLSWPRSATAP